MVNTTDTLQTIHCLCINNTSPWRNFSPNVN